MTEAPWYDLCGSLLHHTHGVAACDLPAGHDGEHGAWCDICLDDGHDDVSDRLHWDRDGETWLSPRKPQRNP